MLKKTGFLSMTNAIKYRAFSCKYVTLYQFCDEMHDFLMSRLFFRRTFAAKTIRNI